MVSTDSMVKVLLIRPWIHSVAPLRAALQRVGFSARFTRVDIEPALHAAVERGGFDVVIVDPATPGLSRSTVEACLRDHRLWLPVVELDGVSDLGEQVKHALEARLS